MQPTPSAPGQARNPAVTAEPERVAPDGADASDGAAQPPRESITGTDAWNEREAVRAAANRELHAAVLEGSVGRLGAIGLAAAGVLGGCLALLLLLGRSGVEGWRALWATSVKLLAAAVLASLVLFAVSRIKGLRAQTVHDLGYVYLFALALLLGLLRHAGQWPAAELARHVSPVVIPILAFGALIPAPPKKALVVAFGAAAMDPLALY